MKVNVLFNKDIKIGEQIVGKATKANVTDDGIIYEGVITDKGIAKDVQEELIRRAEIFKSGLKLKR